MSNPNLLALACPSIRYRLRREVAGCLPDGAEMLELQGQILADPAVRAVLAEQQPDGWLGWDFHGAQSTEAGVRLLCEKGVDPRHPGLRAALDALEAYPEQLERGFGKPGALLDEAGLGGAQMARAALVAGAGDEDRGFVREQIEAALAGFQGVLEIGSIEDLTEAVRGGLVLREGRLWPSIYHLRLLAFTRGWRTAEKAAMVGASVQRLVELSPIPGFHVRFGSQMVAPASFCMDDFNPKLEALDDAGWMRWFHRMELLARLGVVGRVPALREQVRGLGALLAEGLFVKKVEHAYFRQWGAYTGLRLEGDWRDPRRRIYDLTFRSSLIGHYASRGDTAC